VNVSRIKRDYLYDQRVSHRASPERSTSNTIYFIDPATAFSFNVSVEAALVSIVGGIGTLWGPVLGTALLEPTSDCFRVGLAAAAAAWQLIVYAAILMAVILWRPSGLIGLLTRRADAPEAESAPVNG